MSKKRLGRGLDSLLSDTKPEKTKAESPPANTEQGGVASTIQKAVTGSGKAVKTGESAKSAGIVELDIQAISASPFQPRRHFDDDALAELAQSIQAQGLLQPVVVRQRPQGGYELIAGERRWRAAQLAGLQSLPAVIKTATDKQASALALIENVQREDLSALEEAMGLARLRDEFELTQQQIADAVGKSRVAIANLLRLLNLGSTARGLLEDGRIEMGHARALLGLTGVQQDQASRQAADQGLSVRQTEALVKRLLNPQAKPAQAAPAKDADISRLEQRLMDKIGAPVVIKHSLSGQGELNIKYSNLEELDGVLKHMGLEFD